jgi:type II secretory pathway pseudopilin PulG
MKGIVFACLVVLLSVGCERNPVEEVGKEMMVSYDRSKDAADEASLRAMQRYIRSYRALNGRYPESLEELQGSVSGNFDPGLYDYDPRTGSLTLR